MFRKIIILYIILVVSVLQTAYAAKPPVQYDTAKIESRNFDPKKIEDYKNDRQFNYERNKDQGQSILSRFWDWIWSKLLRHVDVPEAGKQISTFWRVFWYSLLFIAIGIVVFFILKLLKMNPSLLFSRKSNTKLGYTTGEEDINKISFDDVIREAEESGNYRQAIRLRYLQVLKLLSDKQYIQWRINKTNQEYIREMASNDNQPEFITITEDFENSWYGELPLRWEQYSGARNHFEQFNQQIK